MREACYLCGATEQLTRDHIPPKGFFPRPLPQNLITVPCCRNCNHCWHKDDEAIRAFFSAAIGRSVAGDAIWEQKVIAGTVARSPPFREYMLQHIHDVAFSTPDGMESLPQFQLPKDRVERFMVRLTKGFLCFHYPAYDYSLAMFTVRHIPPTERSLQELERGLVGTKYDQRGDGVIRYRHGISDTGLTGLWFSMFYDAVWYLVHHAQQSQGA